MSEYKRLVWKFFFKRKWEEIVWFFEDVWGFFAGVMCFLGLAFQLGWYEQGAVTLAIVGLCMIGFWVLIGIIAIIIEICKWISLNWSLAKDDALAELKKRKRK